MVPTMTVPSHHTEPDAAVEYFVCLNEPTTGSMTAYAWFYDRDAAVDCMFGMANKYGQTIRTTQDRADFIVVKVDNMGREIVHRAWELDVDAWDKFRTQRAARERIARRRELAKSTIHLSVANPGWGDF